ncbi:hypothetical protein L917_06578 [Phytophthora nicotianae]|uniref:Uncharacterized protein n=1 Tax=Phytophthora nicotianae TaxID=4792 RepID=W2LG56_PHYNI|nr:hypothetical protein L917_06578 [Phytophthora nicotianae]
MLQTRSQRVANVIPTADVPVAASRSNENPDRLQTFFNSAMERFLKEQRATQGTPGTLCFTFDAGHDVPRVTESLLKVRNVSGTLVVQGKTHQQP